MASFKELIGGEIPVLIDFYATWCGPCQAMAPIIEQVKQDYGARIRVLKIDIDKNPQLARNLGIQGVPTLIIYHQGKQAWRGSGLLPAADISRHLQPFL